MVLEGGFEDGHAISRMVRLGDIRGIPYPLEWVVEGGECHLFDYVKIRTKITLFFSNLDDYLKEKHSRAQALLPYT